ncbi:histone-lysine N-methyltransferase NSD2-like [Babylonia areolata]|uniref:histone-lysine N-methyltransferase NSD2-like n=1 Tax=Babylonia areolata TaxID=304850 RepID=UPI003FD6A6AE
MAEKTNGVSPPQGGGFHRLPQIPTMNRNVKIAQSKAKFEVISPVVENVAEAAVIHIEGTDKIVKINSDGIAETMDHSPVLPDGDDKSQREEENMPAAKPEKKSRKRQRPSKLEQSTPETPKEKTSTRRKRGQTPKSADVEKRAGKQADKVEPAVGTDPGTPKNASPRKAAKITPKGDRDVKAQKSMTKTALSTADQKSTESDKLLSTNVQSESDSDKCAVSETLPSEGNGDGKEVTPSEAPGSLVRSMLECVPVQSENGQDKTNDAKSSPPLPETPRVEKGVKNRKDTEQKKSVKEATPGTPDKAQEAGEPKVYFSAAGRVLPRTVLLRESERPSDTQLARLMEGKTNQFDVSHPVKWQIGDLLWGHVSGHPWWPGMVSSDPFSGLFTTIKGGNRISRLYHVQYFGDEAERGWVGEASSMAFEGKQKLMDYGISQIKAAKDRAKKNKLQQAYCPNQRRKAAWDLAVGEAEDAFTLNKETRIDKYTFVYEFLPNKKTPKAAAPTKSSPGSESTERRGQKRKEPAQEVDEGSDEERAPAPKKARREISTPTTIQRSRGSREEGSFETYCIKHREFVREEHPEYSGAMVIEALKQQWALMTPQQRLRYKSKFSGADSAEPMDVDTPSGSQKRSPRKSRPSLKKLEAESDRGVEEVKRSRRTLTNVADSTEKEEEAEITGRRRKRNSIPVAEEEQSLPEVSTSMKLKVNNDSNSDSCSDFQDDRPRGRPPRNDEDYVLEVFKLNNTAPLKKENLCAVCDKTGELLECQGVCQNYFHPECVQVSDPVREEFKCSECLAGEHSCFSCKKMDKETKRCSVSQCGKFYHEDCVKKLSSARFEGKGFVCPHHVCATCAADAARNLKSAKGRLYRCVSCPTAYHVGDFCIAAGSIHLGGYHILCSNHFQPMKNHKHHLRINVSWCFSCSKGGSLVCCETCPAAFHPECVNLTSMPEDAWYCSECSSGKKPLYGDIIWIKIGNYRWWPAEICHPRNVPTNIQEMAHSVGEFPARFFGSHDYYWTHQGRVFLFQEGDRGSKDTSASRGLFKMYYKGVKEATEAFKLWKAAKENKEQLEQEKNDRKPAPFKFIKTSVPVGNVQLYKADLSEIPHCECKPDQENPCGSDSECLNRMLMYECNPSVCPAKEACRNQRFQKRDYPENVPYRTESRGWGLKTLMDIKKGQFVNEYVGDLIDEEECKRRIKQAHEDNITNFYMLTVDKNRIIDAGPKGNNSRFMNHSCEPNLETQKWMVNGDVRVGLFAIKDIPAGSELTFNYNLECLGNEKTKCCCGSENCSGFLGVRPKTQTALSVERKKRDKDGKRRKKKKRLELKKEHDDECFRCGEGGELVMCDKTNCPKVYHLQCLNLAKPPHGKWLCPWHHCDVCGKLATKLCSECPNSFCQQHEQGVITVIKDSLICAEHTDLIQGLAASTSESTSASVQSLCSSSSGDSDDSAEPALPAEENQELDIEDPQKVASIPDDADVRAVGLEIKIIPPAEEPSEMKVEDVETKEPSEVEDKVEVKVEEPPAMEEGSIVLNKLNITSAQPADSAFSPGALKPGVEDTKRKRSKGQGRRKGTVCRTKARYKAQLKAGSASSSPLPGGASPSLLPLNTDSDNDSGGLVIDLPSN